MSNDNLSALAAREALISDLNSKSKKSKSTRATKYTKIRAHNICSNIASGNTLRAAALAEGISEATFHRWRNEKADFAKMVEQAIGVSEASLVQKLTSSEDWRAAAWILERRFPQTWSKKDHIDMHVSRSEGLDEIKMMIQQTDHLLNIERNNETEEKE